MARGFCPFPASRALKSVTASGFVTTHLTESPGCVAVTNHRYGRHLKSKFAIFQDMNEVANFVPGSSSGCDENDFNYPPFTPRKSTVFSSGGEKKNNQFFVNEFPIG